jgi:hypothetical protein
MSQYQNLPQLAHSLGGTMRIVSDAGSAMACLRKRKQDEQYLYEELEALVTSM